MRRAARWPDTLCWPVTRPDSSIRSPDKAAENLPLAVAEQGTTARDRLEGALKAPSAASGLLERYESTVTRDMRQRERLARVVRTVIRSPLLSKRAARNLGREPARAQVLIDALAGCGPVEDALRIGNILKLVA